MAKVLVRKPHSLAEQAELSLILGKVLVLNVNRQRSAELVSAHVFDEPASAASPAESMRMSGKKDTAHKRVVCVIAGIWVMDTCLPPEQFRASTGLRVSPVAVERALRFESSAISHRARTDRGRKTAALV